MLFEIFFNSKGELRKEFKAEQFNNVFELQRFQELSESFDFISECLLSHGDRFYSIPGKKHGVAVHVVASHGKSGIPKITAAHIGGSNILSSEEDSLANDEGEPIHYRKLALAEFEKQMSEEMSVPLRLLKVTYDFD